MTQKILVTGAAGFIGMHLIKSLLASGQTVVGVDEINDYYDPALKHARLAALKSQGGQFEFLKLDISDAEATMSLFRQHAFGHVIHLAAQAGVRYSLKNPHAYQRSNLAGMLSILEACRHNSIRHLVYASSSSVYGANTKVPFHESDPVDSPVSLYAATKRADELMAHTYSHLFALPATGLRFFTVYGPWGRPDMAYWSFTKALLENKPIQVFGQGLLSRDFTYCDDIVSGITRLIALPPAAPLPHRILNIGNSHPATVNNFLEILENITGKKAIREEMPTPPGDVQTTFADCSALEGLTGYKPTTTLETGLQRFVAWYREYHSI